MATALLVVAAGYLIGSIPVAWLAGRAAGVELRERGSGNVGASNVWQTASRALVVPVGLAQIAQGAAGPLIAHLAGEGDGVAVAAGLAAVLANNWNPWLRFSGGRGVGQAIGILLIVSLPALGGFIVCSLVGVGVRQIPRFVALGLIVAAAVAAIAGEPRSIIAGIGIMIAFLLLKRVLANGPPDASLSRPGVWVTRLLDDRDIRDRDAWVKRNVIGETP
jgi:glycerol-3-phosphate acyltransferase PlsY